ncbi:SURF1 family protein [Verminephrobacter aporrectodeae subsp. tuberculatae]|nr:SURF1 family protein [Verminephrobacter aporrectodeae subsp. tuberculatae]
MAVVTVVAQHEEQRRRQAGQNGDERRCDEEVFHGAHYPVTSTRNFWLISLAAAAGVLATASLGLWQLSRAAQKEALQATLQARGRMPAIDGAALLAAAAGPADGAQAVLHRSVVLEGRWLPEHSLYLDNRQMQGRPGFYVLTPLQLRGEAGKSGKPGESGESGAVLLVQRGWAARNFIDRAQLPAVQTPPGVVRIVGRVEQAPSRLYEFRGGGGAQEGGRIRQNLDLAALRTETGLALADLTVQQTGAASEGLQRDWPVVGTTATRNYAYAFQWFGLCGLMAALYVWFQIVPRCVRARSQPAP